jgi:hypothetical protein
MADLLIAILPAICFINVLVASANVCVAPTEARSGWLNSLGGWVTALVLAVFLV